ncbi:hypothetical protein CL618_01625 [archaeon]|nr:hypothetical protein [archaeon]|tara:strand:+ start:333 stop:641 length:309 start_codon:yes stop_codon:yes gene_type:complete
MAENDENKGKMEDNIELGGNIFLNGVGSLDRDNLIVLKKMVGTYAKEISEKHEKFEKLTITLKDKELEASVVIDGKEVKNNVKYDNLFMGLDEALKKVQEEI